MANKDVFDLFREKASELEQEPTPQAWARIERRIQSDRSTAIRRAKVRRLPNAMSIAAGLALLMGLSVALLWLAETVQRVDALAQKQLPLEIEELVLTPVEDEGVELVEIATANPLPKPAKPIIEGNASQRLVAKNESTVRAIEIAPSQIDSANGTLSKRTRR